VEVIEELGYAFYDYQVAALGPLRYDDGTPIPLMFPNWGWCPEPPVPWWLLNLLGNDFFADVSYVFLVGDVTDHDLSRLASFTHLERLAVHSTHITDRGLTELAAFANLRELDLRETEVTSEGVRKLQAALPQCDIIYDASSD
jgi:hypothetical protein